LYELLPLISLPSSILKKLRNGLCVQGALTRILEQTKEDFFPKILNLMREAVDLLYEKIKEIPCLTCPHKPEGSMVVMVSYEIIMLQHKHLKIFIIKK
jgi:aspartate/methionine/tyrosine aminotransferase